MPPVSTLVAAAGALLAAAGAVYFGISIWAVRRFSAEPRPPEQRRLTPPVSILKSLKGADPHMYAAFRSHCVLDYPEYEVLFGVQDLADPAVPLVEQLREEFPLRNLRLVHCPERLGLNGKVSNLAQMLPQARYEHIVINDSDIVVPRDYLTRVFAPFASPEVGMVTTLYRGVAGGTVGSRLEALGLTDFVGGVLVARALEGGLHFGLGATLATTRPVLDEIGGLGPLADYLADDYELGARVAAAGYRIELVDTIVETALPDYSFGEFCAHQLRWARTVRNCRPAQYVGLIVTFAAAWGVIAVVTASSRWWSWLILAVAAVARLTSALIVGRSVLKHRRSWRDLWLLPLRDFAGLGIWIASFAGNRVEWRGLRFRVRAGKLEQA
ncbi:MAG TPA: bacteriohopanetetrol glucosamine biosynthesis glycosyltransferase HpnI [Candidatus Binatia bacterium]|nr:bacteriohopanetetrol glucosamine biosynthesis glycosyltransferase HpnI [Candidatus Binatia bacterium]